MLWKMAFFKKWYHPYESEFLPEVSEPLDVFSFYWNLMGEAFFKTTGFGEFMLSLTVFHGDHPNRPKSALSFS